MIRQIQFVVDQAGGRLDALVQAQVPEVPRAVIRRALESGEILLNGRRANKGDKPKVGDRIEIALLLERQDIRVQPNPAIVPDVLVADDALLVVNKPAGLPAHPNRPEELDTLANGLVARWPELAEIGDQPLMAGVLHRLDTDTSGLTLVARTQAVFDTLRQAFSARAIEKTYVALVEGVVTAPGRLDHELAHEPGNRGHMVDAASLRCPDRPMRAVTRFEPVRSVGPYTLLQVGIRTGVTHQIRCQLALSGHPVVGDLRYGAQAVPDFPRHFLHASAICFAHPATGETCRFDAPLTFDLTTFLARHA